MAENPRTTSARDNDDHEVIDAAVADADTGAAGSSAGGNLQRDVGSQNDLTRAVSDPEALTRPQKEDDIANNQAYPRAKRSDAGGTG